MQNRIAHNGALIQGNRKQFLELKHPLFAVIEVIVLLLDSNQTFLMAVTLYY